MRGRLSLLSLAAGMVAMHELSIAGAVLDATLRHAAGQNVLHVHLSIGQLRQVVPDALDFAWELITRDTPAEDAALTIEIKPARLRCRACARESSFSSLPLHCAECNSFDVDIAAGDEFSIDWIDVRTREAPAPEAGAGQHGSARAVH